MLITIDTNNEYYYNYLILYILFIIIILFILTYTSNNYYNSRYEDNNSRYEDNNSKYEDNNSKYEENNSKYEENNSKYEDNNSKYEDNNSKYEDNNLENFITIEKENLLNYGSSLIKRNNYDNTDGHIFILNNMLYYNTSNNDAIVSKFTFFAINIGNITPLIFEENGDNYICSCVGTSRFCELGVNSYDFKPLFGTNIINSNKKYVFGWKNGSITTINKGTISYSQNLNNNNNNTTLSYNNDNNNDNDNDNDYINFNYFTIGKSYSFSNKLGYRTYSIIFTIKLLNINNTNMLIDIPTKLANSQNATNYYNVLSSQITCGKDDNVNINNIPTPDECIQSIFKEEGCTNIGNLWPDISNGYFKRQKNGVLKNLTISQIKDKIKNYSTSLIGSPSELLCSSLNKNKILNINSENINLEKINIDNIINDNIINIMNDDDVNNMMVNGIFKLKVSINNKNIFNKEYENNIFYLSYEKLDNNCTINMNDNCTPAFIDNKNCNSKFLHDYLANNKIENYRLVLVQESIVNNSSLSIGKNTDFTIIKDKNNFYLQNINTKFYTKLYKNENQFIAHGLMIDDEHSNISKVNSLTQNKMCGIDKTINEKNKFITCGINNDLNYYLLTSTNIKDSNSINFTYNNDNSFKINLQKYNSYGSIDELYRLISCDYNITTNSFFENSTVDNKSYKLHIVCFEQISVRSLPKNDLNFRAQLVKYPSSLLIKKNIFQLK